MIETAREVGQAEGVCSPKHLVPGTVPLCDMTQDGTSLVTWKWQPLPYCLGPSIGMVLQSITAADREKRLPLY